MGSRCREAKNVGKMRRDYVGGMGHADLFLLLLPLVLPPASFLSCLLSPAPSQKVLGLLLAHSADVNARDKLWQTPLHVAAANRATKCAEALAPLLSSLNVADRSGRSALHHAVHSGHLEVRTRTTPGPAFPFLSFLLTSPCFWAIRPRGETAQIVI